MCIFSNITSVSKNGTGTHPYMRALVRGSVIRKARLQWLNPCKVILLPCLCELVPDIFEMGNNADLPVDLRFVSQHVFEVYPRYAGRSITRSPSRDWLSPFPTFTPWERRVCLFRHVHYLRWYNQLCSECRTYTLKLSHTLQRLVLFPSIYKLSTQFFTKKIWQMATIPTQLQVDDGGNGSGKITEVRKKWKEYLKEPKEEFCRLARQEVQPPRDHWQISTRRGSPNSKEDEGQKCTQVRWRPM